MPPRRNKSNPSAATRSGQATLSFNNKAHRVTKPSITAPSSDNKPTSDLKKKAEAEIVTEVSAPEPETKEIEIKDEKPSTEIKPVQIQAEDTDKTPTKPKTKKKTRSSTASLTSSDLEAAISSASAIPDSRVKKYWKAEEDSRLAPRVHQTHLPIQEKILRHFDLSSQYGPCIGIPRLNRWKRAYTLNLNPPIEVLAVLLKEELKSEKERETGVIAYVDELGGGKTGIVE